MSHFLNKYSFYGDVNVKINIKRERSLSPGSLGDSVSSAEVQRQSKVNYFSGKGEKDWSPTEEFVVNNYNITKAFRAFRENSVNEAEKREGLNCLRILSLSHVFPVNQFDRQKCITKYLRRDAQIALKSFAKQLQPTFLQVPVEAVVYCKNKMDGAEEEEEEEDEEEEEEEIMTKMVKDLVNQKSLATGRILTNSEASFTEKYVLPSIRRVLLEKIEDSHCYAIFDKSIENGKKPDFLLGTNVHHDKDVFFFFVEVKRPDTPSKYQAESDYTKLMKLMKSSIDMQLSLGVKVPVSLGLLVEGFNCTLFQMMQVADGIYMPLAIKRFSLVAEDHELVLLPSVVEALYYVKLEFQKFVDEVNVKRTRKERDAEKARVYHSFDTKTEVEKQKKKKKARRSQ